MKLSTLKFATLAIASLIGFSTLATIPTYADDNKICNNPDIPQSVKDANGCTTNSENTFKKSLEGIINAIIGVAGIVAVIFIVIGGINYITSGGDAGKLAKAKNTILYAVIGLAICALSYAIVNWVILNAIK